MRRCRFNTFAFTIGDRSIGFPNFAIRVVESDLRRTTSRFLLTYLLATESVVLRRKVVHRGAIVFNRTGGFAHARGR
jgi:hypothetical protein